MAGAIDFSGMVPGFDFLQGLMKNAGASVPGMGQWIAPTLDPAEIEKRIGELRTVQFWLEQNARLLAASIQALEVQRMTLATLQTMNLPMSDLRDSLKITVPKPVPAPPPAVAAPAPAPAEPAPEDAAPTGAPPAVDPLQWWGALTQQFTELATQALKDTAAVARPAAVAAPARKAGKPAAAPAKHAVKTAAKAAARAAPRRAR